VGATALAASGTTGLSSPAFAGACGRTSDPTASGEKVSWTLSCSGGNITRNGWVEDTDADNQCAFVKGVFTNDIVDIAKACPKGKRTSFPWTHPGTTANGCRYGS
jgi:hypothetical protein